MRLLEGLQPVSAWARRRGKTERMSGAASGDQRARSTGSAIPGYRGVPEDRIGCCSSCRQTCAHSAGRIGGLWCPTAQLSVWQSPGVSIGGRRLRHRDRAPGRLVSTLRGWGL